MAAAPREAKKARVRRTQLRRSSPHRRRKKTHPKGGRTPRQQEEQQWERSVSKSCYRPGEYQATGQRGRSRSRRHFPSSPRVGGSEGSHVAGRLRIQERAPERSESEKDEGTTELATAPYRCSPQRRISFEEYRSHPGVAGRPEERSRSRSTYCMPRRRAPVVVQQRGRSRSRGAVRLQGASQTRRSREPGVTVLQVPKFDSKWQEYTLLRRGLDGEGFGLRRTMDMQDLDPDFCVYWGRKFRGRQVADGWVELGNGGYIPMDINGTRHVVAHLRGSVGGKGCGGLAQSSGGKGSSGMAAEPWPPARRPAAEEEAAEPQKTFEQFFCKWDDAHFRARVPALLPHGWQQLTNRQIKRLVGKWRKTQHVWRFQEQGGFRDCILALMQEKEFAKLCDGQKEGHWQTFRAGCPQPDEADGSGAAQAGGRDSESRDRCSRSRSRPRRRIAGMDSSDS